MRTNQSPSPATRQYLDELESALVTASPSVRSDLLNDIRAELDGLDETEAVARIARLGDPHQIAADALADEAAQEPTPSRTYLTVTVLVLIFGGYLVAGAGWIAGLVMVGVGSGWTRAVRRRAILTSVAGVVLSLAVLMTLHAVRHAAILSAVGIIVLLLVPFVVNVCVGRYLSRRWRQTV